MNEQAALDVVAVRAVETSDGARALWSDADRAWAGRAAAEVVGEGAGDSAFVARRARLAIERVGEQHPALRRALRALRWRPWVGTAVVAAAFVVGAAVDRIGGAERINLLAPPVFGLLVWNLAVYAILAAALLRRAPAGGGPLRRALVRLSGGADAAAPDIALRGRGRDAAGAALAAAIGSVTRAWAALAAPLYGARAARILHLAAAALALGLIAGLYVRGLAFEYRATWESTFLDAPAVRRLLAVALAPGAFATGLPVPEVRHVAAIRAPASENAALWLHLMAATVAVVVVIPRAALAAVAWLIERRRAARMRVPLDAPYFQRLLRGYRGGGGVEIVPYSYAIADAARDGLHTVLARVFDGSAAPAWQPVAPYGDEERIAALAPPAPGTSTVALFNLAATPEAEAHGAFLTALATRGGDGAPAAAIVDESAWRARWPGDAARLGERRDVWRALCAAHGVAPVFVDLAAPDVGAAERAFDAAFARHDARAAGAGGPP